MVLIRVDRVRHLPGRYGLLPRGHLRGEDSSGLLGPLDNTTRRQFTVVMQESPWLYIIPAGGIVFISGWQLPRRYYGRAIFMYIVLVSGSSAGMCSGSLKRLGLGLTRIHRRDTALALTRGMMGTGRRTGQARSR